MGMPCPQIVGMEVRNGNKKRLMEKKELHPTLRYDSTNDAHVKDERETSCVLASFLQ